METIIIKRKETDTSKFTNLKIFVDDQKPKVLKIGESLEFELEAGYHKLNVTLRAQNKSVVFSVPSKPIEIAYEVGDISIYLPKDEGGYVVNKNNVDFTENQKDSNGEDKAVFEYPAKTRMNEGTLYIYSNRSCFLLKNGETIHEFSFADITDVTTTLRGLQIYLNGKQVDYYLSQKEAKQISDFIKQQSEGRRMEAHPETFFKDGYGLYDSVLINKQYHTFCIKRKNAVNGPTYKLSDIVEVEFQEVTEARKDKLKGMVIGGMLAGKKGALAGSLLAPTKGEVVTQVLLRIAYRTNSDVKSEVITFAYPAGGIERTSNKYMEIKNEMARFNLAIK